MSAHPTPTERTEVVIDLSLVHRRPPGHDRGDINAGALMPGRLASAPPPRPSSTGRRARRGIQAGTITVSLAAIACAREGSREKPAGRGHSGYPPPADPLYPDGGGNNPTPPTGRRRADQRPPPSAAGLQIVNGWVAP